MTTAFILVLIGACLAIFAVINLFLWALEFFASGVKLLLGYLFSRPNSFKQNYFKIRLLVTHVMLNLAFAMLSPRQIVNHQNEIKRIHTQKLKKKYAKYSKKALKLKHRAQVHHREF